MSTTDQHPAETLTADPRVHSLSRHFPTFYFLWKCLISFGNGLWRRRRAIAGTLVVAALSLVVLGGCWETVVGPQRDAVAAIRKAGGSVIFDWEWTNGRLAPPGTKPPWPSWLVNALGRDTFGHVVAVELTFGQADDALMTHIGRLTHLEHLTVNVSKLTRTSLAPLENLTAIETLLLPNHRFSDDDLTHLAGMTKLKQLALAGPQITNKGLAQLAGMRQMDSLELFKTSITSLEPIRGLSQLKKLSLCGSPISDEGLRPIRGFSNLRRLLLRGTLITDAGISQLSTLSNLSVLDLDNTRVGDAGLRTIFELPKIVNLDLDDTRVTDAGLADLADKLNRRYFQSFHVSGPGVTPGGADRLRKKFLFLDFGVPEGRVDSPGGRARPSIFAEDEELRK
jgi:hypothetical protein